MWAQVIQAVAARGGSAAGRAAAGATGSQAAGQIVSQDVTNELSMFGKNIVNHVKNPLGASSQTIKKFHDALFSWEKPLKATEDIFRHIGSYTSKFNPYHMTRFSMAVDNMEASIGEVLIPVLSEGTKLFQEMGDVIAANGPLLREMVDTLIGIGKFAAKATGISSVWGMLTEGTKGAAANKAYRPAQTTTVEQMITNVQTAAYGLGGGKSLDQRTAEASERTAAACDIIMGTFLQVVSGGAFGKDMALAGINQFITRGP